MLDEKTQRNIRILTSVQDRVKAKAEKEGQSINLMYETLLIEALRARDKDKGDS